MRDHAPPQPPRDPADQLEDDEQDDDAPRGTAGFTLLEVMIAVAILSMSLTSLLSSQMASMRATRYARGVSVAAFLAESKLLDLEAQLLVEGWGTGDKTFEGEFSDEGWPDIRYECLIDFVEVPDFSVLQQSKENADTDGAGAGGMFVAGADDQAFAGIGMVWPMIKGAIEQAIRKPSCTVYWTDGALEHEFRVETFWTDPKQLTQLPQAGGEVDETDDSRPDPNDPSGGAGGGAGAGTGGRGGGTTTPSGGAGVGGPTGPRGGLK